MSAPSTTVPVAIRLAATLLLLRDGPGGMEVFMVLRHQEIDFAAGALVFPGGKIAPGDSDQRALARCTGLAGLAPEQIGLHIAAIREAFEECGVLLAREADTGATIAPERLAALGKRYRKPLDRGDIGIADMLEAENLQLACEELVPFAHWITPPFMPKRFDTWFYLAVAPPEQLALHDGDETVDSAWLRPADAVEQARTGARTLVPVTLLNVEKLGFSSSTAEAVAAARRNPIVTVMPEQVPDEQLIRLRIPAEAGYRVTEFTMPFPAGKR